MVTLPYALRSAWYQTPALYIGSTAKIAYDRGFFAAFSVRPVCPYQKKGLRAAWQAGLRASRRQLREKKKAAAA